MRKKVIDLAKQIKQENLKDLGQISEKKIAKIIVEAFVKVKNEIENTNTDKNSVRIPMFGNFKVRMITREKKGNKTTIKRVIFKPTKVKE